MSQVKKGSWVKIYYTGNSRRHGLRDKHRRAPLEFKVGKARSSRVLKTRSWHEGGETKTVTIKPADGYGAKDQELLWMVPSAECRQHDTDLGDGGVLHPPDGNEVDGRITKIDGTRSPSTATIPWPPQPDFEIKMVDVR
jgi:FKBP-type peptidyl-prolyl cis-trans isomerase 2